jgi:hypothetical protein
MPTGTAKAEIWLHSYNSSTVEAFLDDVDIYAVTD